MSLRSCRSARRGVAFALTLCLTLGACAPPQRTYSVDPVAGDGGPLALQDAVQLVFEDRQTRDLRGGETLRLESGRFILDGVRRADGTTGTQEWEASQVAGLELVDGSGQRRWADVKTPDDLLDFQTLPRIEKIVLRDGREIDLGDGSRVAQWSADGLSVRVGAPDEDQTQYEAFVLDDLYAVTLHEPSLIDATLRSPMFWVAGAAAAGLFIWVSQGADENDAVR